MADTQAAALNVWAWLEAQPAGSTSTKNNRSAYYERVVTDVPSRSYAGSTIWFGGISVPTAASSELVFVGAPRPEDAILDHLEELASLPIGWDGEGSPPANSASISAAQRFARVAAPVASSFEPTLHSDGSVLFEIDGGLGGSLRFNSDGSISFAIADHNPATVAFDGKTIPSSLKDALNI